MDMDTEVHFQKMASKQRAREVIEINSDDDDEAPAAKPSPPKRARVKVVVPPCADTPAPRNLPARVDCIAPPHLPLPAAGGWTLLREETGATSDAFMWPHATPVPYCGGGIYQEKDARKGGKKARKVVSRVARILGVATVAVRIDDKAAFERAAKNWSETWREGTREYRLLDGAVGLHGLAGAGAVALGEADAAFVAALAGLNDRDNDFRERCVHAVALVDVDQLVAALQSTAAAVAVKAHVAVYARRALFGLSAHPSVKAVVDYLAPAGQRFPCRAPMAEDATLTKSETPMSSFTIKALLRDAESGGIATPAAFAGECAVLGVELRPYQVQNVFWMLHQEDQAATARTSVAGLNGYYWERRVFPDGGEWFYFPHGGHVLLEPPPVTGGGLLADEMGYGKTVSALALIALDKKRRPARRPQEAGTLVVVPAALFRQWLAECREKAPGLKVAALDARATTVRPADVLGADVCLLRLDQLSQFKVKVAWRRVIVDECQFVANDVGVFAKSVAGIAATNVWMLSGTPITTKIEDLQGEMSLLRVWPFTLGKGADSAWQNHFWESNCKNPWDRRQNECLPTFRSLVKGTMMRHSREQRTVADGAPLVPLPRLTTRWVGVDQDEDAAETYVCRRLELFGASLENAHLVKALQRAASFAGSPAVLESLWKAAHGEDAAPVAAASADLDQRISREVALADAVERLEADATGTNALGALAEFRGAARAGRLGDCAVCRRPKRNAVVLPCHHSFCMGCVKHLAASGALRCGVCVAAAVPGDCFKLVLPQRQRDAAMDDAGAVGSATLTLGSTLLAHSLDDLDGWAAPDARPPRDKNDPRREAFARLPKVLRQFHAEAKSRGVAGSAKLSAVVGEIRRLRAEDITAQFVVVSQYGDVLDELQEALDPVTYTVDISLAAREGKTIPVGSLVEYREHAWDARAVDARVVAVDAKRECATCGMHFELPFPDICPQCGITCDTCPAGDACAMTCKPCTGPADGDRGCGMTCEGCDALYPPGAEPAPGADGIPRCADPDCEGELRVCSSCRGSYGCEAAYRPGAEPAMDDDQQVRCTSQKCAAPRLLHSKSPIEGAVPTSLTCAPCDGADGNACGMLCKPCPGADGRPCTEDEDCPKCKGSFGCGKLYPAGSFPKLKKVNAGTKQEAWVPLCTSAACRAERPVKKGKKVEDLPNLKPLSACPACKNKYGCGRVLRPDDYAADADGVHRCKDPRCLAPRLVYSKDAGEARGTWKPTGVNDRALEENAWKLGRNATPLDACGSCRGKRGCGRRYGASDFEDAGATKLECRDDRCLRPRIVKKGNKFALERNGSALKKHELRAITKKICGACDRQYAAPYPAEGSACVQCGSEEPLEDCDAGLPRNLYTVAYGGRTATNVVKAQLAAKQHRCVGVPSKLLRPAAAKGEPCLTRGGYDNRFKVGDEVTAQRPRVRDGERLEVGMRVRVLDGALAGSPGTVGALLDGDRYEVKVRPPKSSETKRTYARASLEDLEDPHFRPGRVVAVSAPRAGADAFADTLGSIRLDSQSLDRRGALLEAFRSDPETSVLLLTLATAGVGLNITNANKVVILEPFRFGSNEAQAAMRVHRIGQSRDVEIIKFFTRGTMDERLLKLRHKRGELEASGDGDAPSADDVGAGTGETEFSAADLDVLFGITE